MHPFWLATSLTAELSVSRKMTINCEYQDVSFTTLSIGTWQGASAGDTYEVVVPVLTNSSDLVKGTQLVVEMEATEAKTKEGKPLSWKEKNKDLQDNPLQRKNASVQAKRLQKCKANLTNTAQPLPYFDQSGVNEAAMAASNYPTRDRPHAVALVSCSGQYQHV